MSRYIILFISLAGCGSDGNMDQPNPPPVWYVDEPAPVAPTVKKEDKKDDKKKADDATTEPDPSDAAKADDTESIPEGDTP